MVTKHFFKILILFTGMIAFGLLSIAVINHFGFSEDMKTATKSEVAE